MAGDEVEFAGADWVLGQATIDRRPATAIWSAGSAVRAATIWASSTWSPPP